MTMKTTMTRNKGKCDKCEHSPTPKMRIWRAHSVLPEEKKGTKTTTKTHTKTPQTTDTHNTQNDEIKLLSLLLLPP
jgi:hypothetical protein